MSDLKVGQHVTVKLSDGRLVDAEIPKPSSRPRSGSVLQVPFGEETARIYVWQVVALEFFSPFLCEAQSSARRNTDGQRQLPSRSNCKGPARPGLPCAVTPRRDKTVSPLPRCIPKPLERVDALRPPSAPERGRGPVVGIQTTWNSYDLPPLGGKNTVRYELTGQRNGG